MSGQNDSQPQKYWLIADQTEGSVPIRTQLPRLSLIKVEFEGRDICDPETIYSAEALAELELMIRALMSFFLDAFIALLLRENIYPSFKLFKATKGL